MTRRTRERGAVALEAVIMAPVVMALIFVVLIYAKYAGARTQIDTSAASAARAASIERTASAATGAARTTAQEFLTSQGVHCLQSSVTVDVAGFSAPIGQPGNVAVDLTCTVELTAGNLSFGTREMHSHAVSPIDPYRERGQ